MDQFMIEKVYRLVDEIKSSAVYRHYTQANRRMLSDKRVEELSERFSSCREAFASANRYGRHHPDRDEMAEEYRQAKEALYEHPAVRDYLVARRELQTALDDIATEIARSVSDRIPVKREILLTEEGGSPCATAKASSSISRAPGCSNDSKR